MALPLALFTSRTPILFTLGVAFGRYHAGIVVGRRGLLIGVVRGRRRYILALGRVS